MRFAVGIKSKSKADHTVVDAEDALIAALKVRWSALTLRSCTCARPIAEATRRELDELSIPALMTQNRAMLLRA